MRVLALETSCDDTCAAVVEDRRILSNVISSQSRLHERYGGVVPEVAARHHLELVNAVVDAALAEAGTDLGGVDAIAVTSRPGLIGALMIGVNTAKALAAARRLPLIAVNHLHGHVAANFCEPDPIDPPFLCLIASGGHTLLAAVRRHDGFETLGQTLDDAAGEAFDKGARLMGLGYPGGVQIDRLASEGDPNRFEFPVAMTKGPGLDFSFSGLKTALLLRVKEIGSDGLEPVLADLAAGYQRAIVDSLVLKLERALDAETWQTVALGGGVAANSELRRRAGEICESRGLELKLPPLPLCTDNAAMIGAAAMHLEPVDYPGYLDFDAIAA